MKNSKAILKELRNQITLQESASEIESIAFHILEHILHISRADIVAEKTIELTDAIQSKLNHIIQRINNNEPLQYIFEEAWFYGRSFYVDSAVLIPRSETELLVEEVITLSNPYTPGTIIDIGTGSGCIAITLAKELPAKKVVAIDVSTEALKVAKQNAHRLNAEVEFVQQNILEKRLAFKNVELIVSNPPYIATLEKYQMKQNVLDYEPHLALFVSDADPLVFYKEIARQSMTLLSDSGKVVVEINERFGEAVCNVFKASGFKATEIVKDFQQKDRIVKAYK
jgi:release factor glutamine methyltransferase